MKIKHVPFAAVCVISLSLSIAQAQATTTRYTIQAVPNLNDVVSYASGINERAQVVGQAGKDSFVAKGDRIRGIKAPDHHGTSYGNAINFEGDIAGFEGSVTKIFRAYVMRGKERRYLQGYDTQETYAYAINDGSLVGGVARTDTDFLEHAVVWRGKVLIDINAQLPPNTGSEVFGVNNLEYIVGDFRGTDQSSYFGYATHIGKTPQIIAPFGSLFSIAEAVNNKNMVCGYFIPQPEGPPAHGFVWKDGIATDVGLLPGGYDSQLFAINDDGVAVGNAFLVTRNAVVYANGQLTDLNTLVDNSSGWLLSYATGINRAGQIVGQGTLNGKPSSFVLTPEN